MKYPICVICAIRGETSPPREALTVHRGDALCEDHMTEAEKGGKERKVKKCEHKYEVIKFTNNGGWFDRVEQDKVVLYCPKCANVKTKLAGF